MTEVPTPLTKVPTLLPPGTPCWASLLVHRADLAQEFYGALFGWEFVPGPPELGRYVLALLDGARVAGIGEGPPAPHRPVSWTTMLAAEDTDHTAELVRECGGTVGVGPLNVGAEGRLAMAVDPSGAVFGVWQAGLLSGADVTGEPGSVAWNQLVTRDSALVGPFYRAVFGYEVWPAGRGDERDRLLLTVRGRPVADVHGVAGPPAGGLGAHWMTYFATSDPDAAARRAVELGGALVVAPHDSPYGRVCTVTDPQGAEFALITPGTA
ncbi:VOC family protein [Streptomyces sp. CA-111067]|uniref:VOC family protein n=1 Tax=Streptomyces sp. CA-111067 TaxID=3240046 RepID=UPI003D98F79A